MFFFWNFATATATSATRAAVAKTGSGPTDGRCCNLISRTFAAAARGGAEAPAAARRTQGETTALIGPLLHLKTAIILPR